MAASDGKILPDSSKNHVMPQGPILSRITTPGDLKSLKPRELAQLAADVRAGLIDSVTRTGGHLGASLGTVELTIALHYVFNSPRDKMVWDVGHQAYTHKLLTGRKDAFGTLRKEGGISGFLSRDESEHDAFGAGHASTSISAALGMCVAEQRKPKADRGKAIAIIGDGALTGGMAYEGLNNAGHMNLPLIVILNDNEMSIAPNVGAMSKYLTRLRTDPTYNRAKDELSDLVERLPQGGKFVELGKRVKDSMKEFIYHSALFEELGFTYVGPVNGHNIPDLISALKDAADSIDPVFLHVITQKGKGYEPAKADIERSHAVSAPAGMSANGAAPVSTPPKYQDVLGQTLVELAKDDDRIYAVTAAMPSGTSLGKFKAAFPERFFDVGIAEQHAVTFAAGLAAEGLRPVAGIYSTFLQRAYDQIIHDVCVQRLPVIFALDRAGFAGDDGRTHHGVFDLSYLRCLPNLTIMAPRDECELRHMIKTAIDHTDGPVAIRYPRGTGLGVAMEAPHALDIGKAQVERSGGDVALIAIGSMVKYAEDAAAILSQEGIAATVVNARFVKPLDQDLILHLADTIGPIVTIEENTVVGGFGSSILELLAANNRRVPTRVLGVPDHFFEQASQNRLRDLAGIGVSSIVDAAREITHALSLTQADDGRASIPSVTR